jgi:hypothetical protein
MGCCLTGTNNSTYVLRLGSLSGKDMDLPPILDVVTS